MLNSLPFHLRFNDSVKGKTYEPIYLRVGKMSKGD